MTRPTSPKSIVKNKIDKEIISIKVDSFLSRHECKPITELKKEFPQM